MNRLRLIFTAVAAITGYIIGGVLGMDYAAKHAPEFSLFGLQGHIAGAAAGALVGAVLLAVVVFFLVRELND